MSLRYRFWRLRYKSYALVRAIRKSLNRQLELLHTPKAERPVKRKLWKELDLAAENLKKSLGARLYGMGEGKDFDGLGTLVDDRTHTVYGELKKKKGYRL